MLFSIFSFLFPAPVAFLFEPLSNFDTLYVYILNYSYLDSFRERERERERERQREKSIYYIVREGRSIHAIMASVQTVLSRQLAHRSRPVRASRQCPSDGKHLTNQLFGARCITSSKYPYACPVQSGRWNRGRGERQRSERSMSVLRFTPSFSHHQPSSSIIPPSTFSTSSTSSSFSTTIHPLLFTASACTSFSCSPLNSSITLRSSLSTTSLPVPFLSFSATRSYSSNPLSDTLKDNFWWLFRLQRHDPTATAISFPTLLQGSSSSSISSFTYMSLVQDAARVGAALEQLGVKKGDRVAFLLPPGIDYVRLMLGSWSVSACAVPLCAAHRPSELHYIITNSAASVVVAPNEWLDRFPAEMYKDVADLYNIKFITMEKVSEMIEKCSSSSSISSSSSSLSPATSNSPLSDDTEEKSPLAMLIYTSGTTGRPKGVEVTQRMLQMQALPLVQEWEITSADCILHILPLHHVHGILNTLLCPLIAGAQVHIHPSFNADKVLDAMLGENGDVRDCTPSHSHPRVTVFSGVPTMYQRLINACNNRSLQEQTKLSRLHERMRLMMCGSAACPSHIREQWKQMTGIPT